MITFIRRWFYANPLAWLFVGVALYFSVACTRASHRHVWKPVDEPIAGKESLSTSFKSDLQGTYIVQIDMQRNGQGEGMLKYEPPQMVCQVTTGDAVRVDRSYSGRYGGETFGKVIAIVDAVPGKTYHITLHRLQKDDFFDRSQPRLQVRVAPRIAKRNMIESANLAYGAIFSMIAATLCILVKSLNNRKRKIAHDIKLAGDGV